ncbi:MAG: hypothetical protein ACLU4N_05430 [Butyricimonas faecihominis]
MLYWATKLQILVEFGWVRNLVRTFGGTTLKFKQGENKR